jgi:hypothetical protein
VQPSLEQVRDEFRNILETTGMSNRQLSLAMGRDAGYVSALLDPSRPSRATPTPADLERLSDATDIPLVNLLEQFWGISSTRLAEDLSHLELSLSAKERVPELTDDEMREVIGYADYLVEKRGRGAG